MTQMRPRLPLNPLFGALLVGATLGAGCTPAVDPCADVIGSCLTLRLESGEDVRADRVRVRFSIAGASELERVSNAPDGQLTKFPVALALVLGTQTGAIAVDATAEAQGAAVLHGTGSETLSIGEHKTLTIQLGPPTGDVPVASKPAARSGAALAYFPDRKSLVMFGGLGTGGQPLADTWEYSAGSAAWQLRSGSIRPAARATSMAYDSQRRSLILFGGQGVGSTLYGDVWVYDQTGAWSPVQTTGAAPAPRTSHGLAYDTQRGALIVFGGYDVTGPTNPRNDFYELLSTTLAWTMRAAGPPMVRTPKLIHDGRYALLIGADESATMLVKAWRFDQALGNFTDITTASPEAPAKRQLFSVGLDRISGTVLLFGGVGAAGPLQDTYTLSPLDGKWQKLATPSQPGPRVDAALEYVPDQTQLLLVGGRTALEQNAPPVTDAWRLVDRAWQLLP